MMQAAYSAASGLSAQQKRIDTIADNVANVNTPGYKNRRTDFKDALYSTLPRMVQPQDGLNMKAGHGVLIGANSVRFTQGSVVNTEIDTDFCIEGDGFFAIETAGGERFYTRAGAFSISMESEEAFLVTNQGHYVLDNNGERISIPGNTAKFSVDSQGFMKVSAEAADGVTGDSLQQFQELGKMGIYTFPNKMGLESIGGGLYQTSVTSGGVQEATDYLLHQGSLEGSNVDLSQEVTRLIRTQRAFSFASRALSMADQMEGLANNLRR